MTETSTDPAEREGAGRLRPLPAQPVSGDQGAGNRASPRRAFEGLQDRLNAVSAFWESTKAAFIAATTAKKKARTSGFG